MELAVDLHHLSDPPSPATLPADLPTTSTATRHELAAALGDRVAPVGLARERLLPAPDVLADLFPEGGLVRGRAVACAGPAATSLALGLVAPAVAAGAWLAVIDVPSIGLDAACEHGIALERIVAVRSMHATTGRWPEIVGAAADGFDVLLLRVPADVPPATMRKVAVRLRRRGVVTVVLGDPGALECEGALVTGATRWEGLGGGHGHLRRRTVEVRAVGRRMPGRRACTALLPTDRGALAAVEVSHAPALATVS